MASGLFCPAGDFMTLEEYLSLTQNGLFHAYSEYNAD
jgi:hypothetical protein